MQDRWLVAIATVRDHRLTAQQAKQPHKKPYKTLQLQETKACVTS